MVWDQFLDGVSIIDVGNIMKFKEFLSTWKVLMGRKTKADIYHFHDPELIFQRYF